MCKPITKNTQILSADKVVKFACMDLSQILQSVIFEIIIAKVSIMY